MCLEGVLHSALKMGVEKEGTKSGGGYVGGFFQLFDWSTKSRKKLFAAKSDLPGKFTVFVEHTDVFISLVNFFESVIPNFMGLVILCFTVGNFFFLNICRDFKTGKKSQLQCGNANDTVLLSGIICLANSSVVFMYIFML